MKSFLSLTSFGCFCFAIGCGSSPSGTSTPGTGGTESNTGGTASTEENGGASNTGGVVATGGIVSTGGTSSMGGAVSTGGTSSVGGSVSTGGTNATGGVTANAGSLATGGTNATGGMASTAKKIVSLAAGSQFTCATLMDGTVWCLGDNSGAQLGNAKSILEERTGAITVEEIMYYSLTPVKVLNLTSVTKVRAGIQAVCAIKADQSIWCWGGVDRVGSSGKIGDGVTTYGISAPVRVLDITTAIDVDIDDYNACAVLADGTVKCWGWASSGLLGTGEDLPLGASTNRLAPTIPVKGITTAVSVRLGLDHRCALLADGTVKCWGLANGGFGIGISAASSDMNDYPGITTTAKGAHYAVAPISVPGVQNAKSLAIGYRHTCVLITDGTVQCWGSDVAALGSGNVVDAGLSPAKVLGITNAVAVECGRLHTCALLSTGRVMCWGVNGAAQIGDDTLIDRYTPVEVAGIENAVFIATGDMHTCAMLADGTVKCWGYNMSGELGNGSRTDGTDGMENEPLTPVVAKNLVF